MRTPYEQHQGDFSACAHEAARRLIYPDLFGTEDIEFEHFGQNDEEMARHYDGQMGIDLKVFPAPLRHDLSSSLCFHIQERFRRPAFREYKDITLTEFNHNSRLPSELYKIASGIFVYGYYHAEDDVFTSAYAVDMARVLLGIQRTEILFSKNRNKKNQDFICIGLEVLRHFDCILWESDVVEDAA